MNIYNTIAIYRTAFTFDEIQELKQVLKDHPNLLDKLNRSSADWVEECSCKRSPFRSPPLPAWADPLPEKLHIGRKVRVIKGPHAGKEGVVAEHWLDGDHCSGGYGHQKYQLDTHYHGSHKTCYRSQNNSCGIFVKDCEFVDEEDK